MIDLMFESKLKLKNVLDDVTYFLGLVPIRAMETGTSFAWDDNNLDNLSTLNIIKYLCFDEESKLLSVDINPLRINKCKDELVKRNLQHKVSFLCSDSLMVMFSQFIENYYFNFFWLDSSEDSTHAFKEYQLAKLLLKRPGAIAIDDYNCPNSVKWQRSSGLLKQESSFFKEYKTPTGLIIGYYE